MLIYAEFNHLVMKGSGSVDNIPQQPRSAPGPEATFTKIHTNDGFIRTSQFLRILEIVDIRGGGIVSYGILRIFVWLPFNLQEQLESFRGNVVIFCHTMAVELLHCS